jgi:hypothetical protein
MREIRTSGLARGRGVPPSLLYRETDVFELRPKYFCYYFFLPPRHSCNFPHSALVSRR